jgi:hypothetical protein
MLGVYDRRKQLRTGADSEKVTSPDGDCRNGYSEYFEQIGWPVHRLKVSRGAHEVLELQMKAKKDLSEGVRCCLESLLGKSAGSS